MNFETGLGMTLAMLLSGAFPLGAQNNSLSICKLMDDLISFRNRTVEVRGEVVGSFYHGFSLAPEGQAETCPDWPERGFTRRALIALTFPPDENGRVIIPSEFSRLDQMKRKGRVYPKVTARLLGRIQSNWLILSYRIGSGKWLGLIGGYYPDNSTPAILQVQQISDWILTIDPKPTKAR
jgi:hypothetical protein